MEIPKIRVAIIDDEINSIKNLTFYLNRFSGIHVIKTLNTFEEAVAYLSGLHEVDVIFLDINLGKNNGFELLDQLYGYSFKVVFVTAYEEYAVKAFRKNALDYILKPIDEQELSEVISKIEHEFIVQKNELPPKGNISKDRIDAFKRDFITVRQSANIDFIPLSQIMYIEASGNYSQIVTDGQSPAESKRIIARSVAHFEKNLPADQFFRVHKSFIANFNFVSTIRKKNIQPYLVFTNGMSIPISRRKLKETITFHLNFEKDN